MNTLRRARFVLFAVFGLAFLVCMLVPCRAQAAVVTDGNEFSIDVGAAKVCFVVPRELRNDRDCKGLTVDAVQAPPGVVAFGLVRLEREGDAPELARLTVTHLAGALSWAPNAAVAKDYAKGVETGLRKTLPAGATVRESSDARAVRSGRFPFVRAIFDVDGVGPGADALIEHQVHIVSFTSTGAYGTTWTGRRSAEGRLEPLADKAASTIWIRHAAEPEPSKKAYRLGQVVGMVLPGVALLVVILVLWRRSKRCPAATRRA